MSPAKYNARYGRRPGNVSARTSSNHGTGAIHPNQPKTGPSQPNQSTAKFGSDAHNKRLPTRAIGSDERRHTGSVFAAELIERLAPQCWPDTHRHRYASA